MRQPSSGVASSATRRGAGSRCRPCRDRLLGTEGALHIARCPDGAGVAGRRHGPQIVARWTRASRGAFYARTVLVTLCGGVGAARMLSGLVRVVPPSSITAIVNVGDDTVLHGLHISPDLDTITYTLAGMDNRETGWGVAGETWTVMEELDRLGGESWFRLGDRDLATHLFRTERLRPGTRSPR